MTPGIRITLRCTFSPLMDKGQAGPGDPAAHRTDRLPLLPSGPGGVHRVLLHRAQPLYPHNHSEMERHLIRTEYV